MLTATPSRRFFAFASVAVFAIVFVVFTLYERPALGLGHFFYFAIALAALAGGRRVGVGAGFLSAGLYAAGVLLNSHVPSSSVPTLPTVIRAITFVAMGALIGWFAETHRRMVAELSILAERDAVTGLPNTRAFEIAVDRRLKSARPFTLLVGDIDALDESGSAIGPDESLRALSELLSRSLEPDDDIARIGGAEFAVLTTRRVGKDASDLRSSSSASPGAAATRSRSAGRPSRRTGRTRSRFTAPPTSGCTHASSSQDRRGAERSRPWAARAGAPCAT